MSTMVEEQLVIRPRRSAWMAGVLAALLVAVFAIVGILLRGSKTGAIFQVSDQIAMIALAGALRLFCGIPRVWMGWDGAAHGAAAMTRAPSAIVSR